MNHFYWDASGLGKRFSSEVGTPLVNNLFDSVPAHRMMALIIGAGEVTSIIVRRYNVGNLSSADFSRALAQLQSEVIGSPDFRLQPADVELVHASFAFIPQYSLNATDAIVLRSALDVAAAMRAAGDDLVLVASDARLISAAQAEGLLTFNPEADDQPALQALVAPPPEGTP